MKKLTDIVYKQLFSNLQAHKHTSLEALCEMMVKLLTLKI